MNKIEIQEHLKTDKSLKEIAAIMNTSQTNLRYWIKKHSIVRSELKGETSCLHCKKESTKKYCSTQCKSLYNYYKNKEVRDTKSKIYSKEKREVFKLKAIAYGGGCCQYCGYNKNYSALSFHHTDPSQKDFSFSNIRSTELNEQHKKELDKCIFLCHNCHMKVHNTLRVLENKPKSKQSIKGQKIRRRLIDVKQGRCKVCGITGINDIFAFHHRVEAEKCDLLCHNCHTETHLPNNLLNPEESAENL